MAENVETCRCIGARCRSIGQGKPSVTLSKPQRSGVRVRRYEGENMLQNIGRKCRKLPMRLTRCHSIELPKPSVTLSKLHRSTIRVRRYEGGNILPKVSKVADGFDKVSIDRAGQPQRMLPVVARADLWKVSRTRTDCCAIGRGG